MQLVHATNRDYNNKIVGCQIRLLKIIPRLVVDLKNVIELYFSNYGDKNSFLKLHIFL